MSARHRRRFNAGTFRPAEVPVARSCRRFYVSGRDGSRWIPLLGPYASHLVALQHVDRGRRLAIQADRRAHFYAFGTCSLPESCKTVFGR